MSHRLLVVTDFTSLPLSAGHAVAQRPAAEALPALASPRFEPDPDNRDLRGDR